MFKKIKKTVNQVTKTVENTENQSVETAEKCENISAKSDSIFPDAKDTLKKSMQKWKTITSNEILEKINLEASKGERMASFYDYYISDELLKELRSLGYKVEVFEASSTAGPKFKVYW